jgi:hypothetical protein
MTQPFASCKWSSMSTHTHTPQALSHYSYHVTSGQFLLCDLQGKRRTLTYQVACKSAVRSASKLCVYHHAPLEL